MLCTIGDEHQFDWEIVERTHGNGAPVVVIDAGAANGEWLIEFAKQALPWLRYQVFCLEPSKHSLPNLRKAISELPPNFTVVVIEKALAGSIKTVDFIDFIDTTTKYYKWSNAKGLYEDRLKGKVAVEHYPVETTTLNEIVRENNLRHIDYLKMDIEGFELETLEAFQHTLDCIRQLSFEYHFDEELARIKQVLEQRMRVFLPPGTKEIYANQL